VKRKSIVTQWLGATALCVVMFVISPALSAADQQHRGLPTVKVCDHILSFANEGKLNRILIAADPKESSAINEPKELLENGSGWVEVVFKKLLDINHDGVLERVFVTEHAKLLFQDLWIYRKDRDEEVEVKRTLKRDETERDLEYPGFVEYKGVTYLVSRDRGGGLIYVAYVNAKNEMSIVCEFGRKDPLHIIKKSSDEELCRFVSGNHHAYVPFTEGHSLEGTSECEEFKDSFPGDRVSVVDINNDGKKEPVVYMSHFRTGCHVQYVAALKANRSELDEALSRQLPSLCGMNLRVFEHRGKTYLDSIDEDDEKVHRGVYKLENGKLDTVCEFQVRPVNYILSPVERIRRAAGEDDLWNYAISQPGVVTVESLIKGGVDINNGRYESPLEMAIDNGRLDIAEILLKAGADVKAGKGPGRESALVRAVEKQSVEAVRLLVRYGAKDHEKSCSNALMWAMGQESTKMLELLLDLGISVPDERVVDAVMNDYQNGLKVLIARGIDVNRPYTGNVIVSGITQASGVITVGPEIKMEKSSKTLMEWALQSFSVEVLRMLREASVKKGGVGLLKDVQRADKDLEETYTALYRELPESERAKFHDKQTSWIDKRDKECGLTVTAPSREGWYLYVAADEARSRCVIEATIRRAAELSVMSNKKIVLPLSEKVEGFGQGDWSKLYWEWSKSFAAGQTPADNLTSACIVKESAGVVTLAGSSGEKPVVRTCEIKQGKYLFVPVMTSLVETKREGNNQCDDMTFLLDEMTRNALSVYAEVDEKKVLNLRQFRQRTGCFTLNGPSGKRYAASDGYWLMLKPLSTGHHTLRFGGRLPDGFSSDVTYHLIVR